MGDVEAVAGKVHGGRAKLFPTLRAMRVVHHRQPANHAGGRGAERTPYRDAGLLEPLRRRRIRGGSGAVVDMGPPGLGDPDMIETVAPETGHPGFDDAEGK